MIRHLHPYEDWRHPAHRPQQRAYSWYDVHRMYYPQGYVMNNEYMRRADSRDQGPAPYVIDIEEAAERNNNFRIAIWTGQHQQVTLMSIPVGGEIGLEVHPGVDQFLRIEDGDGLVQMGSSPERLDFQRRVEDGDAIMIPAGTWHNLRNTGNEPLKLYSIYSPPQHPHGTVHQTQAEAMAAEQSQHRWAL